MAAWKEVAGEQGIAKWIRGLCATAVEATRRGYRVGARPGNDAGISGLAVQGAELSGGVGSGVGASVVQGVSAEIACGHPAEPWRPGKCKRWGCVNYAYAR